MFDLLPFVRKNLWRNRRRTILTILSVAVSLFLLGVLLAVYALFFFQETSEAQAQRLITRHKVSLTQMLPAYYEQRIEEIPGVEAVAAESWYGGVYKDNRPENFFARFAADPETVFTVYPEFTMPAEQLEAFRADRQGLAVGRQTAERVGLSLGQRITIRGDIYPADLELTVRAIYDGPNSEGSYFHVEYLNEGLPQGWRDLVGFYVVRTISPEESPRVAEAIDEMFRNAPEPTKTESESAFLLSFISQLGNIKLFLLSIAGAIVFTIMLVSANTMAMSVRERFREVAVMKTLGFRSGTVLGVILAEAALLSLAGGALGAGMAWVAAAAMEKMMVGFFTGFRLPLWGVPVCLATALLIGVISSLVPALSASRMRITEALRHTG